MGLSNAKLTHKMILAVFLFIAGPGRYGYMKEYPAEKMMRDGRVEMPL